MLQITSSDVNRGVMLMSQAGDQGGARSMRQRRWAIRRAGALSLAHAGSGRCLHPAMRASWGSARESRRPSTRGQRGRCKGRSISQELLDDEPVPGLAMRAAGLGGCSRGCSTVSSAPSCALLPRVRATGGQPDGRGGGRVTPKFEHSQNIRTSTLPPADSKSAAYTPQLFMLSLLSCSTAGRRWACELKAEGAASRPPLHRFDI